MRIALVDPSRTVQRIVAKLINEDGHELLAFVDGLKALDCIRQDHDIRALITSTEPHSISGVDLCAAARNLTGERRALHIILMSSTDDYHLAVKALDNGADDFIHKPPIPDELRARLRLADRVTAMKQHLIQHATTDALTGVFNRRSFFKEAAKTCGTAQSSNALSAIMFDIDHFKSINENFGHECGDNVLIAIAKLAKDIEGTLGRLGGEEFALLVNGTAEDALDYALMLQRSIRNLRFICHGQVITVTCSFGIAEWENGDSIDRMLRRADIAMYEAKRSGRNKITISDTFALTKNHDQWRGATRAKPERV
jgi:two-component system cell cycle response regulator